MVIRSCARIEINYIIKVSGNVKIPGIISTQGAGVFISLATKLLYPGKITRICQLEYKAFLAVVVYTRKIGCPCSRIKIYGTAKNTGYVNISCFINCNVVGIISECRTYFIPPNEISVGI